MPIAAESQDKCLELVQSLARRAVIVVQLEQSYDIIDEMSRATDLNKVLDGFSKLSRLVTKVYNDIASYLKEQPDDDMTKALNMLGEWNSKLSEFYNSCLKNSTFLTYVKIFTSLSIAPDELANDIKEKIR